MRDFIKQFVIIKPVVMEGFPDAQNVFLKVTNQEFCITKYGCETAEEAEWMREMFCVAMETIIQKRLSLEFRALSMVEIDIAIDKDHPACPSEQLIGAVGSIYVEK